MFRRVVLVAEMPDGLESAVAFARAVCRMPEHVHVIGYAPVSPILRFHPDPWDRIARHLAAADERLARLARQLADWASVVTTEPTVEWLAEDIRISARSVGAEAILVGPTTTMNAIVLADNLSRLTTATNIPVAAMGPKAAGADSIIREVACLFDGHPTTAAALAAFWRGRLEAQDGIGFLALGAVKGLAAEDVAASVDVSGLHCRVRFAQVDLALKTVQEDILRTAGEWDAGLFCALIDAEWEIGQWLGGVFLAFAVGESPIPVLLIPARGRAAPVYVAVERLSAADAIPVSGEPLSIYLEKSNVIGMARPLHDMVVELVRRGERVAVATAKNGYARFGWRPKPPGDRDEFLGLGRATVDAPSDPVAGLETKFALIAHKGRRLALFDAALDDESLRALHEKADDGERRLVAVATSRDVRLDEAKERMIRAGFDAPRILDAGQVLGAGLHEDIPSGANALVLARCARRLRAEGVDAALVVTSGPSDVVAEGFAVMSSEAILAASSETMQSTFAAIAPPPSPSNRFDAVTVSRRCGGNRVEFEFDNRSARENAIRRIDAAESRVHVQAYIVRDEVAPRAVEAALVRAVRRGLRVRVLVDALYSLHDALGAKNPLLERLEKEGVEVRASRPLDSLPSIDEIKRRDHRKLIVVDGNVGIVTGRNLADSYYVGFDEVALTPETSASDVPWLDCGATVEGPVVADIERSFRGAWAEAGGDDFAIDEPASVGTAVARFVVHEGMRDANTLDAYLAMIDGARSRIVVVNTFPLQFELLEALEKAVARGVAVTVVVGNVRPVFGDDLFFPGGAIRELATQVIHGRVDRLVEVGAECREYAIRGPAAWAAELGVVRPHVHGKVMSVDGRVCAVGSANLDITAGYWESEGLLIVEDEAATARLDAEIAALLADSKLLDRDDPAWRRQAEQRAWISRNWPSIIG